MLRSLLLKILWVRSEQSREGSVPSSQLYIIMGFSIIACKEAWLKDGKETWKRLIMAHTTLDSSFSIWFSSAVNGAVSPAQRSRLLLCHFLSPQGYGVVHPQGQIPTPNASCFWKGAPVLLWIWCLELAVWNLNTQKLFFDSFGYVR